MKHFFFFIILLFSFNSFSQSVVINELDCDTPSIDDKEFIELKSATPNFSLDGHILVFFNGSFSGANSSYFTIELDGQVTDGNGLLLIGSTNVTPFPQLLMATNVIQNGADAVAIYLGGPSDFPLGTTATQTNLIDALAYDTSDSDDTDLMELLGLSEQINEGSGNNTNSIQRNNDGTYTATTPTPGVLNDGTGIIFNAIEISVPIADYSEGDSFDITFTTQDNVDEDYNFTFSLNNNNFNEADFTGNTSLTINSGENTVSTTITLTDDSLNEGDEELLISFADLPSPVTPFNNNTILRVIDNNFIVASFGTPIAPTYGNITSTQPENYYDPLNGFSSNDLETELQNIIAKEGVVRAQTYADVTEILKEADQNPANSSQVWLVYTEAGRSKLDFQTTSNNVGTWNREHTFPRSLAGYFSIDADDFNDGKDIYWNTNIDSLRHGNSDAHALRAADGPENSSRNNQHYGEYNGPEGTSGSFKGDVARSVLYMQIRYNGLSIENDFPDVDGQLGDLQTLLEWHRNDPPDDFEMNRNNIIYTWQYNRNPFIDLPDLVEYIWGNKIGSTWNTTLNTSEFGKDILNIYPNPITDKVFISGNEKNYFVTIYSSEGKKILSKTVENNTYVDLKVSSGLYILKITSNGKIVSKKILLSK